MTARHMALFSDEADFQAQLVNAAKKLGWRAYHTRNSRGSEPGFPDLVLASASQRRVIFAELKRPGEEPSEDQAWWGEVLTAAGEEYYLLRYVDWDRAIRILARPPQDVATPGRSE